MPKSGHAGPLYDGLLGLDYLKLNTAIIPEAGSGFLIRPGPVPVVSICSYMSNLAYTSGALACNPVPRPLGPCHINGRAMRVLLD